VVVNRHHTTPHDDDRNDRGGRLASPLPSPPFCFRIARRPGCICMVTTLLFSLACFHVRSSEIQSAFMHARTHIHAQTRHNSLSYYIKKLVYGILVLCNIVSCYDVIKHRYIFPSFQKSHSILSLNHPLHPSSRKSTSSQMNPKCRRCPTNNYLAYLRA
jgi:hypothetical protein